MAPIRTLLDQADQLYAAPGQPYDGFFYNEMTRLANLPTMAAAADELRDRNLQSLARKLRGGIAASESAPALVSALLGRSKLWPTPLVSDAEYAASAELVCARRNSQTMKHTPRLAGIQIGRGTVSAVCDAGASGELFLGFDSGSVFAYRSDGDQVVKVVEDFGPLTGLAVDPNGMTVVVSCRSDSGIVGTSSMACFRRLPNGWYTGTSAVPTRTSCRARMAG
jgi:hypothetical protein